MSIATQWPSEKITYADPVTGVEMTRLTCYKGNHNHLYFTNPGWYDGNKRLVICGDRDNRSNLFSICLQTGAISQLTDLPEFPLPYEHVLQVAAVDGVRNAAYLCCGRDFLAVDLKTLQTRKLWEMPRGYLKHVLSCSQDADYLYTSIYEDLSHLFPIDIERGYIGFNQIFEHHPHSQIIRIATDGSGAQCIYQESCWIGHVNVSPMDENRITFCHEGPWDRIDHRIWGMDVSSGAVWKIRPCAPGETVGHEYWYQDSAHLGYHGRRADGSAFFGTIGFDGGERLESAFSAETGHIHSADKNRIVGDGGLNNSKYVVLWQWDGVRYRGPKVLCEHRSSFKTQRDHVHPRFTPDGGAVLFSSDCSGYTSVYLAQCPSFEQLPDLTDL